MKGRRQKAKGRTLTLQIAAIAVAAVVGVSGQTGKPEATSLSGKPLYRPATLSNQQKLEADLAQPRRRWPPNRVTPKR